jgi:type IV pilus assembly protein PilC
LIQLDKIKKKQVQKEQGYLRKLSAILNTDIRFGNSAISDGIRFDFYFELQVLLTAGVDIRTALELIAAEQKSKNANKVFIAMSNLVVSGRSLSEAMQELKEFSNYEFYSVQIGEESGKLNTVLKELASFYKSKLKLKRQLVSALTYPSVILLTSFSAVFFMLNFIVPMFSDIFKRFGSKLPWITQQIVYFSSVLRTHSWWMLLLIFMTIYALYMQRNTLWYKKFSTLFILKIPIVKSIILKIYLARFSNSMALLIAAKVPILRAIQLVRQMIKFYPIENSLEQIEKEVLKGKSLHSSMQAFTIYPAKMISLIKVAEEVNQLDHFFVQIAEQYTQEVEHQSSIISSLLEPIILIVLGAIVGIILISMYLPLFQMTKVF